MKNKINYTSEEMNDDDREIFKPHYYDDMDFAERRFKDHLDEHRTYRFKSNILQAHMNKRKNGIKLFKRIKKVDMKSFHPNQVSFEMRIPASVIV